MDKWETVGDLADRSDPESAARLIAAYGDVAWRLGILDPPVRDLPLRLVDVAEATLFRLSVAIQACKARREVDPDFDYDMQVRAVNELWDEVRLNLLDECGVAMRFGGIENTLRLAMAFE